MDPNVPNPPLPEQILPARQAEALAYRRRGYTWREIGRMMGIRHDTAYEYAHDAMKTVAAYDKLSAEECRRLELERLDAATRCCMEAIESVDGPADKVKSFREQMAAIDRLLRIQKRRSMYLGLDQSHRVAEEEMPTDMETMLKEIREAGRKHRERERTAQVSEN